MLSKTNYDDPKRLRLPYSSAGQFLIRNKLGQFEAPRYLQSLILALKHQEYCQRLPDRKELEDIPEGKEGTCDYYKRPAPFPNKLFSSVCPLAIGAGIGKGVRFFSS